MFKFKLICILKVLLVLNLIVQDEPVKYYMKYMTKPPLFSSKTERQSRQQKPETAASYRELIEIQKRKTTERDDRHVFVLLNSQRKIL